MRGSDALRIAREVQTGATRSYVQAALELAAYVIEQESMRRPPQDGEDVPSVRPAAPSGSDSNAEPVVPEGKIGDVYCSHGRHTMHEQCMDCLSYNTPPREGENAAVRPTVYPVPTPVPPTSRPSLLVSDPGGWPTQEPVTPVPPTNRHPPSCQCPSCLYGHICKICQKNYTTSEYCSWQCAQGKPVK